MSAIKRICALAAAAIMCFSACAAPRYSTREAVIGDYSVSAVYDGSVVYQSTQWLTSRTPGAVLDGVYMENEQYVSAGDTAITYTAPVSDVDVARAELAYSRALDDHEYEMAQRGRVIDEYRAASESAADGTDARIYELMAMREELLLSEYEAEAVSQLQALEAARDSALASHEPRPVSVGISGTVNYITNLKPGESISVGRDIVGVFDPHSIIIRVPNPNGALKYGMKVTLRLDGSGPEQTIGGTVVSADNVLPGAVHSGMAYVLPDVYPGDLGYRSAAVTADTLEINDVTIVSASTVQYRDGKPYVRILDDDGSVRVRYVDMAMIGEYECWIISGVEPGDKLITK